MKKNNTASSHSAIIAKHRLDAMHDSDDMGGLKQKITESLKRENTIDKLYNALHIYQKIDYLVKETFKDAGVPINDDQAIEVIAELPKISRGCKTRQEFANRIRELDKLGCFRH